MKPLALIPLLGFDSETAPCLGVMHRWAQEPERLHKVQFRCPVLHMSVTTSWYWFVLPASQPAWGLASASLCLRNQPLHQPHPGILLHFHTPLRKAKKAILCLAEQSPLNPPAIAWGIHPIL